MRLINSIPSRYEDGFIELNSLSADQFAEIESILPKLKLTASIEKLVSQFDSKLLAGVSLTELFESMASLVQYIDNYDIIGKIVDDIIDLIAEGEIVDLDEFEEPEEFAKRLKFFLTDKHIYYASKSEDLIENYGNAYVLSRTLSDIRPVFDLDVKQGPKAGFVIHTLAIHYQSNEEPFHKNISIQLTGDQIKNLQNVLNRATDKENELKKVFIEGKLENLIG